MISNSNLDILFDDGTILIINKESGLLTHQSKISPDRDSLVDRLQESFNPAPSPVHRLDRPTSGIIICTGSREAARFLGEQFTHGKIEKSYIAVVRGYAEEEETITIPLKKDGEGEFQNAETSYRRLNKLEIPVANNRYKTSRYSLIQVKPQTGRFHQIRRHMARIGHPILGDTSHGDLRHNRIFEEYFKNNRLLLHSDSITFTHPVSHRRISVSAPVPREMNRIIKEFSH